MKRREFLRAGAAAAAGLMAPGLRADERPNVLIIETDQMRRPMWMPELSTPNIGRLAAAGVSWTNHFCSAVPCSPSRACLLTGTYTIQNEVYQNVDSLFPGQKSLTHRFPTVGNIFAGAGYQSEYRGKWHLARSWDRNPRDPFIDYGFAGWRGPDAPGGGTAYCGAVEDPRASRQTVKWLSGDGPKQGPWLMFCSFVDPHDICEYPGSYPMERFKEVRTAAPPDNWTDDLSTKPSAQAAFAKSWGLLAGRVKSSDPVAWRRYLDYYGSRISMVDRRIGEVLDALERSGQRERTIVALTSDHGEMAGSHQLRTKGPFMYEESINIPLIFSWPGHIPAGRTAEAMSSNVDVVPTLASLAGIKNLPYLAG